MTLKKAPAKPKKAPAKPTKQKQGRVPPEDLRSERLVVRIHPDLMAVYVQRAREVGLNRSTYIERVLVRNANEVEGAELDAIGKRRRPDAAAPYPAVKPKLTYALPGKDKATTDRGTPR